MSDEEWIDVDSASLCDAKGMAKPIEEVAVAAVEPVNPHRKLAIDIGMKNFAGCLLHNDVVVYCDKFAIGNNKQPINELIDAMLEQFHKLSTVFIDVDEVVIEMQRGNIAIKNYAISAAVYAFYKAKDVDVRFENPTVKFKKLQALKETGEIIELRELDFKQKGKALKKLSVEAALILAKHYNHTVYLETASRTKKLDDISDCMLYSIL